MKLLLIFKPSRRPSIMKRILSSLIILAVCISIVGMSEAQTADSEVYDHSLNKGGAILMQSFVSELDPEKLEVVMDHEPEPDGTLRHLYLDCRGSRFDHFRVDRLVIETVFNKFNPVREWENGSDIILEDAMQGYVDAVVTEKDVNAALAEFQDEHWKNVVVDLKPGQITAKGYYYPVDSSVLRILVKINTGLHVKGRSIWLDDYELEINNADKTSLIRDEIKKIQPLLDLEDLIFPVEIDDIKITEKEIRLRSSKLPSVFKGMNFNFSSIE